MPIPQNSSEITIILTAVGLPSPDRDGYLAISKTEGSRFAEAVGRLADGRHDPPSRRYVEGIVLAVSQDTRRALAMTGAHDLPLTVVIGLAKQEGSAFRDAISFVLDAADEAARLMAINHLRSMIEEATGELLPAARSAEASAAPARRPPSSTARSEAPSVSAKPPVSSERTQRQIAAPPVQKSYGESVHVYGGSAALCIQECVTPRTEKPTVAIEAALASAERVYNWGDKLSFMLSLPELPLVLGVLTGSLSALELRGHGQAHEKTLRIEPQGNQFFVRLSATGAKVRAVPVPARDSYFIVAMLLNQLIKNHPFMTVDNVLQLTHRTCALHQALANRKED